MRTNFLWVFTNFTFYHSSSNTVAIWFEVGPDKSHRELKILICSWWWETRLCFGGILWSRSLNNSTHMRNHISWFCAPAQTKQNTLWHCWVLVQTARGSTARNPPFDFAKGERKVKIASGSCSCFFIITITSVVINVICCRYNERNVLLSGAG